MKRRNRIRAAIELMEVRCFFSASADAVVSGATAEALIKPTALMYSVKPDSGGLASPYGGFTPAQMRAAYGVSSISFNGTAGDGTGETIAIIDAYDDPNAASDLAAFDTYYSVAAPPSFQKLNQAGAATPLPGTDPSGPNPTNSSTWEEEESLDIEWTHVMAPAANIVLYEANNSSSLYSAVTAANANSAVTVMSMSWGGSQSNGESAYNSQYFNQSGITYLASTGDDATPAGEPSTLANVIAVGGTSLYTSGSTYSSESGWSDGGGGIDRYDAQPSYQSFTVTAKSTTRRTTPDVSIDADPDTGVPIYDSWDFGATTPWVPGIEGGTSLASPMWAGLIAVADQGRALDSLGSLKGITQTLPRLYQLPASNYHDVTTGNNGLAAGVGYDLVTGIGTPVANLLVPDLAGTGTITGQIFVDNGGNGVYGGTDTPISGRTVYLDLNNDGVQDNSEPSTTTNSSGIYTFTDEPAGGSIRLTTPAISGYTLTSASSAVISYGSTETVNFTYTLNTPAMLGFTQQPTNTPYGSVISPVIVAVQSTNGGTAATFTSSVTLTLNNGTFSNGSNTVTATTVNGLATFSNLQVNVIGNYLFTATDGSLTSANSSTFALVQATPTLTWAAPAAITYGTALSATQLDATASVPGTFAYTPAAGTVLSGGTGQSLSVVFTPTDTTDYLNANGATTITVTKAVTTVSWTNPASIVYGTALSATQLDATASMAGTFIYTPASGTVLSAGANQSLGVVFVPTNSTDYANASGSAIITVTKATPTITWATPASITYGTALSATQLDATASTAGTFTYNPSSGTVLSTGTGHTLNVTFTPTNSTNYTTASGSTTITVVRATPVITWTNPASITYGTALSATQLDATANVAGAFVYTPGSGTVLGAGAGQALAVSFTPTDATDYTTASGSAAITVNKATPTITWTSPASIAYGTALSTTQLDATANVSGTFAYNPSTGVLLNAGTQTLGATFTPTDTTDYVSTTGSTSLVVSKAVSVVSWTNPAAITYGTALSSTQLDATASVAGTFTYNPSAGTVLNPGANQTLSVAFTPTNSTDYTNANGSASITVNGIPPSVLSLNRSSPSTATAGNGSVSYLVTFSEPVTNVQANDFVVLTGSNVSANSTVAISPGSSTSATYAITINSVTGFGSLGLELVNSGITDAYGDALASGSSPFVGQTYLIQEPINLTGSTFYLKLDSASPQDLDVWTNSMGTGSPAYVQEFDTITSAAFSSASAADSFAADFSNGNVVPAGGLAFNGYGSATSNSLTIVGTGGNDVFSAAGNGNITFNSQTVAYTNIAPSGLLFAPVGSSEALNVSSGTVTLVPGTSTAITTEIFSSINIAANANLVVPTAASHASRLLIETGSLTIGGVSGGWTGTLDLSNNDLDIANGNLTTVNSQIAQGFATGNSGIISSAAQTDTTHLTTLGVIQNSITGSPTGAALYGNGTTLGLFDGANPASTDVLVKYTYFGDANLDGKVDGSDYSRIDNASQTNATGWFNGDINYDGVINGSDYTLIDNAYNTQGASLAAQIATPAAQTAAIASPAKPTSLFSQVQLTTPQNWATPDSAAAAIFSTDSDSLLKKLKHAIAV